MYQFVLRQERLALIDHEIKSNATILLNSDLINLSSIDFTGAEDIINKQLGGDRIGKFFIIRDSKGVAIYKSISAQLLNIDDIVPSSEMWTTVVTPGGRHVRVLTVAFADRKLQVGNVISKDILAFGDMFSADKAIFLIFIFITGVTLSWFLTAQLLSPLSIFANYIGSLAENKDGKLELPPIPTSLAKLIKHETARDDFQKLISSFDKLIERVNKGYKLTRFWSYQMAHELKTPMAVIEASVSKAVRDGKIGRDTADNIITEVLDVSETITSFLNWAEVENSFAAPPAHVNKIHRTVRAVVERLNLKYNDRIQIVCKNDFSVYSNQQQFELVCANLISNACKYSHDHVVVEIADLHLTVKDSGSAIPQKVLEHLGEPFNFCESNHRKSSGLGLAYVVSVCRIYDWEFEIDPQPQGNAVTIYFADLETDDASPIKKERPDTVEA